MQGQPQGLRLPVFAHKQAEIARAEGALLAVSFFRGTLAAGQPRADRRRQFGFPQQQLALQELQAQARHLIGQLVVSEGKELQGQLAFLQLQLALLGAGLHCGHLQLGQGQPRRHQGVEGLDQGFGGAAVLAEAMEAIGPGPGPLVGGQVSAAEAVDGLLGVPHQHHQMVGPGSGFGQEGPLQDPPLDRIGVLEFIDQGDPIALAQGGDQGAVLLAGGTRIEAFEQLGKTHAAAALAPPQ